MNHTLPALASTPPVPGEHGYYHAKHRGATYRAPDGRLLFHFSLKEPLERMQHWVTYNGIVPEDVQLARRYG